MRVTLTVIAGPHAGSTFNFDRHDTFLVGRSCHAHFQLPVKDRYFSRIHFMMEVNPPQCRLIDMGSHNGTYVNGQRVLSSELRNGDQIRAGHTVIRLNVQRGQGDPSPSSVVAPENTPAPPDPGVLPTIPRYTVIREQSRDGLGVVYIAKRTGDDLLFTIRTITPKVRPTPTQLDDFLRAARFLLKLQHRLMVQLCDVGATGDLLFFVSEHVPDAVNAAALVQRDGPQPMMRVMRWGSQILQALRYAHGLHFVHCDIKPSNLLVTKFEGREIVKLADFGIARVYQCAPFSGLSITGDILSAAAFLPPEVLLNYQQAKPAADQYAVAATLYFLMAGTHALNLPTELHRRFSSLLHQAVVPLRERRPDVPAGIADVIHKAMARAPAQRYKNVVDFRHALVKAVAQ
jgi:eukaryotic-like serine/threonine-protein kinase